MPPQINIINIFDNFFFLSALWQWLKERVLAEQSASKGVQSLQRGQTVTGEQNAESILGKGSKGEGRECPLSGTERGGSSGRQPTTSTHTSKHAHTRTQLHRLTRTHGTRSSGRPCKHTHTLSHKRQTLINIKLRTRAHARAHPHEAETRCLILEGGALRLIGCQSCGPLRRRGPSVKWIFSEYNKLVHGQVKEKQKGHKTQFFSWGFNRPYLKV